MKNDTSEKEKKTLMPSQAYKNTKTKRNREIRDIITELCFVSKSLPHEYAPSLFASSCYVGGWGCGGGREGMGRDCDIIKTPQTPPNPTSARVFGRKKFLFWTKHGEDIDII